MFSLALRSLLHMYLLEESLFILEELRSHSPGGLWDAQPHHSYAGEDKVAHAEARSRKWSHKSNSKSSVGLSFTHLLRSECLPPHTPPPLSTVWVTQHHRRRIISPINETKDQEMVFSFISSSEKNKCVYFRIHSVFSVFKNISKTSALFLKIWLAFTLQYCCWVDFELFVWKNSSRWNSPHRSGTNIVFQTFM